MSSNQKSTLKVAEERLSALATSIVGGAPASQFPALEELPRIPGQPQGCMWGFYDKGAKKDEIGSVNLLTQDVVKAASREISTGEHIQLDWSLDNVTYPGFGRKEFQQKIIDMGPAFAACDDELNINTQSGSQWDSLKHFAHQASKMYYNGLTHEQALASTTNGIHNWCERGGIVGRGVLLDWVRWYEQKHGKAPPSAVTRHEIPVQDLEEVLKFQGTTLRPADILIVRSGYVRWHNFANGEERMKGTRENSTAIGLAGNEEMVRWLYDHHFAAVAGDTVAFEAWPPEFENGWCLHEWLLTQWGTPIGEMWDLETLSRTCERNGRWTFFLTSAPLHVKGGIGSPPGAIAIF